LHHSWGQSKKWRNRKKEKVRESGRKENKWEDMVGGTVKIRVEWGNKAGKGRGKELKEGQGQKTRESSTG